MARVAGTLKFRAYDLIARAVEDGVVYGHNRAYKYTDKPSADILRQEISQAVISSLCEILEFE